MSAFFRAVTRVCFFLTIVWMSSLGVLLILDIASAKPRLPGWVAVSCLVVLVNIIWLSIDALINSDIWREDKKEGEEEH